MNQYQIIMKTILCTISAALLTLNGYSQDHINTRIIGEDGFNVTTNVSHLSGQNILLSGFFGGNLTGEFPITFKGGNSDGLLVKINEENGQVQSLYAFGGAVDEAVLDATTDADGNMYVMGYFKGAGANAMDADPGPGSYPLSVKSVMASRDLFIIKLAADGSFVWAKQISNPYGAANEDGSAIELDVFGNIYISGTFNLADFDPSINDTIIFSSGSGSYSDGFIVKLNNDGEFQWVSTIQGNLNKKATDMYVYQDKIFVTGTFKGTVDLDPSETSELTFTSQGVEDVFLAAYDLGGHFEWGTTFGGAGADYSTSLEVVNNIIYVAGYFTDSLQFTNLLDTTTIEAIGSSDGYVAQFNLSGAFQTATPISGSTAAAITTNAIQVTSAGTIVVSGSYASDINIGGQAFISAGSTDNFYIEYQPDMSYANHYLIEGDDIQSTPMIAQLTNDNMLYIGTFRGTAEFDYIANTSTLTTTAQRSMYITQVGEGYLALSEKELENAFSMYPNPATTKFQLTMKDADFPVAVEVVNMDGKVVKRAVLSNQIPVDVSELENGIYLVKIYKDDTSLLNTIRLVKQ